MNCSFGPKYCTHKLKHNVKNHQGRKLIMNGFRFNTKLRTSQIFQIKTNIRKINRYCLIWPVQPGEDLHFVILHAIEQRAELERRQDTDLRSLLWQRVSNCSRIVVSRMSTSTDECSSDGDSCNMRRHRDNVRSTLSRFALNSSWNVCIMFKHIKYKYSWRLSINQTLTTYV